MNEIQSRLSSTRLSGRLTLGITPDYKEEYGRGGCVATKEGFKCKPMRLTQEFLKEVIHHWENGVPPSYNGIAGERSPRPSCDFTAIRKKM